LINSKFLDEALEKLINDKYDSIVSVYKDHGFWWDNSKPMYNPRQRPMRQSQKSLYKEAGMFYIFNAQKFKKENCRIFGKTGIYEVPKLSSIIEIDDHAYLKRDIEAFKSVGGLDQVKSVKELIIKDKLTDEDPDDFYLRHNGGGQFEIRREVDISPVSDDNGQPLIFYAEDLKKFVEKKTEETKKEKAQKVIELQDIKQTNKKKTISELLEVEGS